MPFRPGLFVWRLRANLHHALTGPQLLAFVPAASLGSFWLGGEPALLITALTAPVLVGLSNLPIERAPDDPLFRPETAALVGLLDKGLDLSGRTAKTTAAFSVHLDDFESVRDRFGAKTSERLLESVQERICGVLREDDLVARTEGTGFHVALAPAQRIDLEAAIQISSRFQVAIAEPFSAEHVTVYLSCSVGFCLASRAPGRTGESMLDAADSALTEARRNGPGVIRSFSEENPTAAAGPHPLLDELPEALENGQIRPWFQPQISTDTGKIAGFEALARWVHPREGVVPPNEFLPLIEHHGLTERLGELILYETLKALKEWDNTGEIVPSVGVNFSQSELCNPKLSEKVKWELDRFSISPNRLNVEILETVVDDTRDDIITRNIANLSALGCGVDLDDFGTGHASISNIRRFSINRLKIDRSFVANVDRDGEQQKMVRVILTMAEQLGLETLAEGVETIGEHSMMAQLGCDYIQGFGLARPMPFEETRIWMSKHNKKLAGTPQIGRAAG